MILKKKIPSSKKLKVNPSILSLSYRRSKVTICVSSEHVYRMTNLFGGQQITLVYGYNKVYMPDMRFKDIQLRACDKLYCGVK